MNLAVLKGIAIAIIIGIVAVGAYYLAGPLFYKKVVDEPLPIALNELQKDLTYEQFVNMADEKRKEIVDKMPMKTIDLIMGEAKKLVKPVSEDMQSMISQITPDSKQTPKFSKQGTFEGLAGHQANGKAVIISVGDIAFLRFEDFEVTNGPDLHVYITKQGNVENGIELGKLKGSQGNQNYALKGIDTSLYDTVVIYCQPFHVYFASAKLS